MERPSRGRKSAKSSFKKRPPNAFLLFCRDERPAVCARCPGLSSTDVSSLLSHLWRSLSEETKQRYRIEEQRLQAEFDSRTREGQPRVHDPPPRASTLDLPHLSAALITGKVPAVLPSLESVNQQKQGPAPAVAKRFGSGEGQANPQ
jgi:hypothetical protein